MPSIEAEKIFLMLIGDDGMIIFEAVNTLLLTPDFWLCWANLPIAWLTNLRRERTDGREVVPREDVSSRSSSAPTWRNWKDSITVVANGKHDSLNHSKSALTRELFGLWEDLVQPNYTGSDSTFRLQN